MKSNSSSIKYTGRKHLTCLKDNVFIQLYSFKKKRSYLENVSGSGPASEDTAQKCIREVNLMVAGWEDTLGN